MIEKITTALSENIGIVISATVSFVLFFLGRYTSYRDDYRKGMKELNDNFYRPFLSVFNNAHKAYAYYICDLPLEVQEDLVSLMIKYQASCSPILNRKINDFVMIYSGYSACVKDGGTLDDDELQYIEQTFQRIYTAIEKLCKKNSRKLYCSIPKRIWYFIIDTFYVVKINISIFYEKIKRYSRDFMNKKRFWFLTVLIFMNLAYFVFDYFNIPALVGVDVSQINWDIATLLIGNSIVIGLYLFTYFLIDKKQLKKEQNQKVIACIVLEETYYSCKNIVEIFCDEKYRKSFCSFKDNKELFEDAERVYVLKSAFENESMINDFAKSGIINEDAYRNFLDIKAHYNAFISAVLWIEEKDDLIADLGNNFLKDLDDVIKNLDNSVDMEENL